MEPAELHKKHFSSDACGYKIITQYYYKYYDLFQRTDFPQVKDFLNQIFLNIAKINFSDEIKNEEAYIIGSIKIQCRVQLDKALKIKNRMIYENPESTEDSEGEYSFTENLKSTNSSPHENLETQEIFQSVNIFKLSLKVAELELFNNLIESIQRQEIAEKYQMNLNTLDTQIRRLRIKFVSYLKNCGYSFTMFKKYEID